MPPALREPALVVYRGDVFTHVIKFQQKDKSPLDVSWATFAAQMREQSSRVAGAPMATFDIDASQASVGVIVLTLDEVTTAGLSGSGSWDLYVEPIKKTWLVGVVKVAGDVTHD